MKWVLEFNTCALDHHFISLGLLTMWLRGGSSAGSRGNVLFLAGDIVWHIRLRENWQVGAGWSSGFRGAGLPSAGFRITNKTCLHQPASADSSPSFAQCAVNYHFNPCQRAFIKSTKMQRASMQLMKRISATCNTICRFKSLPWCQAFTHNPDSCPSTPAPPENSRKNLPVTWLFLLASC